MVMERTNNNEPDGLEFEEVEDFDGEVTDVELEEIEQGEFTELDDGSAEIILVVDEEEIIEFGANLAEYLEESALLEIGNNLLEEIESDIAGRADWVSTYVQGLQTLGLNYENRTEPWENACGVHSTVLTEAAIRFQAETMGETFPASGPVKTLVMGEDSPEKKEAAVRVQEDMNYQLTEVMTEYRPEHERMLFTLGLAGSTFKKVYKDPTLGRQTATFVNAEDVIVPYGATDIDTCERVTHVMRKTVNEVARLQASGFYRDEDLGDPEPFYTDIEEAKADLLGFEANDDDRHTFYEVHAALIIEGMDDEDGLAKPYVVTIERSSGVVLGLRRNWEEGDHLNAKRQHFVHYTYVPGFGFYGMGLIHLVGGYARAGTSLIRQLVDAGSLANLPGGLKAKGLRVKDDDQPIGPGEFKDVDVVSGSIKDNIMLLPYKEPSATLLALLDKITQDGRRMAATSDLDVSDMSANAPVGTTLALLERTLKPMTAVQARVHYAMKGEFKLLKKIIAEHAPEEYTYDTNASHQRARRLDYETTDIIPVSDPNSSTMAQRVVQYQTAMEMARAAPHIYDEKFLHRQMLEVIDIPNAEKIVPMDDDMVQVDPVSENMAAMVGKPVKAFILQDHDAHIAVHQAFMQDPTIAQLIGQNPMAQRIMASLHAHVAEHGAFSYRKQIETKLGAPLSAPNEELPVEIEQTLSQLMATAAIQVAADNKKMVAAQQAQQQAQDPVVQNNKAGIENDRMEIQRKAQKDATDKVISLREQLRKERKDLSEAELKKRGLEIEEAELSLKAAEAGETISLNKRRQNDLADEAAIKIIDGKAARREARQTPEFGQKQGK